MDSQSIIKTHAMMLKRLAASYERDIFLRQDLVQEMMMALVIALPNYSGEGSLKAFVARVAHNIAISHVRRAVRQAPQEAIDGDLPDSSESAETSLSTSQQQQQLQQAVQALPIGLKQVIILALEGLSYREISEALDISENNVAVRFNRAKQQLKQAIEEKGASS